MSNDEFIPAEKNIYRYKNGDGDTSVNADPMLLRGKLTLAALGRGTTMSNVIKQLNQGDDDAMTDVELSEAWKAADTLAEISAEVFQLAAFDPNTGNGADMAHAIALVDHFYLWCEKKNPMPDSQPTSTPPSESISATLPTTDTCSV